VGSDEKAQKIVDSMRSYTIDLQHPNTMQGERVLAIAGMALELFVKKNNIYGEVKGDDLGSKGQFADMHRKWKRIRAFLWDGEPWPADGESFEEVVFDMIGHMLLTIDFVRDDR
jgi:hypothetical protein